MPIIADSGKPKIQNIDNNPIIFHNSMQIIVKHTPSVDLSLPLSTMYLFGHSSMMVMLLISGDIIVY